MAELATAERCPGCKKSLLGSKIEDSGTDAHYRLNIGVEYAHGCPERYDGVSEWLCPHCGRREGRWTGQVLEPGQLEPRFGVHR